MSSWHGLSSTISKQPAKQTKAFSKRISNGDSNHYKSKGHENGLSNIRQQEQEVHALQKALNLPPTKTYSTTLVNTIQATCYNSAVTSAPVQPTRVTMETDVSNGLSLSKNVPNHDTSQNFYSGFDQHDFPSSSFCNSLGSYHQPKDSSVSLFKEKDRSMKPSSDLQKSQSLDGTYRKGNGTPEDITLQNRTALADMISSTSLNDGLNDPRIDTMYYSNESINAHRNYPTDSTGKHVDGHTSLHRNHARNPPITTTCIDDLLNASSKLTRSGMGLEQQTHVDRQLTTPLARNDGHLNETLTLHKTDLTNPLKKHIHVDGMHKTCYTDPVAGIHVDKHDHSSFTFHKPHSIIHTDRHLITKDLPLHTSEFMHPLRTRVDEQPYVRSSLHDYPGGHSRTQVSLLANESLKINGSLHSRMYDNGQMYRSGYLVNHPIKSVYSHGEVYDMTRNSAKERGLFGQVKEAYKIIQHQNETIAKLENIISELNKKLKTVEMEQEASLQEIQTLKLELDSTDVVKAEGIKKREALLTRINQLDQDFKELSMSHNALLVECKKREGDFLQTDMKLNALEAYNNNLRQGNARMQKECELAKQQMKDVMAENRRIQLESQQTRGEAAQAMQEQKQIALEKASLQSASSELRQQLTTAKSVNDKLTQEFEKLQMEYNVKCNRVSLLEEEVKQQQETLTVLQHELEESFHREARKTALENSRAWNMSSRQRNHSPNSHASTMSNDLDTLTKGDNDKLNEQLLAAKSELARLHNKNKSLKEKLDYTKHAKSQLEEEVKEITVENDSLFAEVTKYKEMEYQAGQVKHVQEELDKIKGKLSGLEEDKCALISELQEFQQDKVLWEKEKGELIMSLAELEAENNEMRQKLKTESEKSVTEEVHVIKQELDNVHKMLRLKDQELVNQSEVIEEKQKMLNKLTEEAADLKKGFADISTRTTTRNLVISSLGKQLEERDQRIEQLENELSNKSTQFEELCSHHTKLEEELSHSSSEALQWITADKKKLEEHRDMLKDQVFDLQRRLKDSSSNDCISPSNEDELAALKADNIALVTKLESLIHERDSVLQDSEDLMEGMQQLKEAFEDEIERRLEREREKYLSEQNILVEEQKTLVMEYTSLREQQKEHDEAQKKLELHCKNLEFERDELRKQVNELCENAARNEDKSTQTDQTSPNPRRKDRGRKRSQSIGAIIPIRSMDTDDSNSSPERSPTTESHRKYKSQS